MSADPNTDAGTAPIAASIEVRPPALDRPGRLALVGVLVLAAALRLWNLDQNGYSRMYYAAGVRSMMDSFHCFFYNCFDPVGFVSLDKPPVSMWLEVLSAKMLGFSAFSILLPQVLEGVAAVALIYVLVARTFGRTAALLAAGCLAVTPISVAVDRSNNTDSCLTMVLLLAAWAAIRAAETGRVRLLVLAVVLAGVGFNVKMAAALVVVPTFLLVYWLGAQGVPMQRRLTHLAFSGVVLAVVSLSWSFAFDLTPPGRRPYAGSTQHNSMLELAVLHNGIDRFIRPATGKANAQPDDSARTEILDESSSQQQTGPSAPLWDPTPIGPLRLATPHLAAQLAWLLPFAIAGIAFGAAPWRRRRLSALQLNIVVWSGWAFSYAVVFSFAGGVFHTYYLAVLAPPLAALSGIGCAALWARYRDRSLRLGLPAALLATAAWQVYLEQGYVAWRYDDWRSWLLAGSAGGLTLAAAATLGTARTAEIRLPRALTALGLLAMLATPLAWALSTVLVRPNVAAPVPDIGALAKAATLSVTRPPTAAISRKLVLFLRAQRGAERFLLAVPNALQAAPFIVRTGEPVMAMGGYLGRDPILSPREMEQLVNEGQLRFVMLGGYSIARPDTRRERALREWIQAHGTPVDPALWREATPALSDAADRMARPGGAARLYDLRARNQTGSWPVSQDGGADSDRVKKKVVPSPTRDSAQIRP